MYEEVDVDTFDQMQIVMLARSEGGTKQIEVVADEKLDSRVREKGR